jgi:4a-hydroxytetrahydrobiopterin dehydratase
MARPTTAPPPTIDAWLAGHPGWEREGAAITRRYSCPDFSSALALAVRVGMLAEKKDHHPDLELGWGRVRVTWSTHDAGGVTELDLQAAEATDALAG